MVEIRLDLLNNIENALSDIPSKEKYPPLLFTARCAEEGGKGNLSQESRESLLQTNSDLATAVDIEIANLAPMEKSVEFFQERDIPIIASSHDFYGIPDLNDLRTQIATAKAAGASVAKFAVTLSEISSITTLVDFLREDHDIPISIMGMGSLGAISRVIFAQYGSVLNYGYLGNQTTAPGQWTAELLKEAISQSVDLSPEKS